MHTYIDRRKNAKKDFFFLFFPFFFLFSFFFFLFFFVNGWIVRLSLISTLFILSKLRVLRHHAYSLYLSFVSRVGSSCTLLCHMYGIGWDGVIHDGVIHDGVIHVKTHCFFEPALIHSTHSHHFLLFTIVQWMCTLPPPTPNNGSWHDMAWS